MYIGYKHFILFSVVSTLLVSPCVAYSATNLINTENKKDIKSQQVIVNGKDNLLLKNRLENLKNHLNYLNKLEVTNGVDVKYLYKSFSGDGIGNTANYLGDLKICDIELSLNTQKNTLVGIGDTRLRGFLNFVIDYTDVEQNYLNEFILGHEAAHCGFSQIKQPFFFPKDKNLSSLMNIGYADHIDKIAITAIPENGKSVVLNFYGLAYALNEAYADTYSSVVLLKKYNQKEDIVQFLKKLSIERELSASFMKDVNSELVDAYDISFATRLLLTPEYLKKVSAISKNDDLRDLVLEIANVSLMEHLSRKKDKEIDVILGEEIFKFQANLLVSSHDGLKKPGSLTTEGINKVIAGFTPEEKTRYIAVKNSFGSRDSSIDIFFGSSEEMGHFSSRILKGFNINKPQLNLILITLKKELNRVRALKYRNFKFNEVLEREKETLSLTPDKMKEIEIKFKEKKKEFPLNISVIDYKNQTLKR